MEEPLIIDREAFFAWAEAQPSGRYERAEGEVVRMPPQRAGHVRLKGHIWLAFANEVTGRDGLQAIGSGVAISVDEKTDYEPDASVHFGPPIPGDSFVVPNPIIVAEVISPFRQRIDSICSGPTALKSSIGAAA